MSHVGRRKTWWIVVAAVFVAGGWLGFRWFFPPFVPPALPVPNGYDGLLRAGEMVASRTGFYDEMSAEELAAVVTQNEPALALAREALTQECVVPLDWSANRTWFDNVHMKRGQTLRSLGRAFGAEARQARINGRTDDALRCGSNILRLAEATAQGGLAIDWLVARGVQYTALHVFRDQADRLSAADCAALGAELSESFQLLEPPSELLYREAKFFRQMDGLLQSFMMASVMRAQHQQMLSFLRNSAKNYAAICTVLQGHLAIRRFQLDQNRLPESLDELVPDYLPAVLMDPFSDKPLVYRRQDDRYLLYSVGQNQIDDGGVEGKDNQSGDLLLEPHEQSDREAERQPSEESSEEITER